MRYFLTFSYCGTAYCGWQIQPNSPSIQATIEDIMSTLLNEKISAFTQANNTKQLSPNKNRIKKTGFSNIIRTFAYLILFFTYEKDILDSGTRITIKMISL